MSRVVASIEARMGASRLPGKVLMEIGGIPAIEFMAARVQAARSLDAVVVATTVSPADDAIAIWASEFGIACYRGSEDDVLGRVVAAQRAQASDIVVELCGDCPLIAPELIDRAVNVFRGGDCDVATSAVQLSYPQGTEVQVFPFALLAEVAETVDDPAVREHVSLYFYEHPERYRIRHLDAPPSLRHPEYRLQVDYREDLEFVREIVARLVPRFGQTFNLEAIVDLLRAEPALSEINRHCREKLAR
jgi:spore coat polysaccharide biosynthesis protein SpsF